MPAPLPALRWTLPGGVQVAWSTAADGDQREVHLREAFARPLLGSRRLIVPRQVHGVQVATHDAPDLGNVDGVVTTDPTISLGAYGADCPGVVLVAPEIGLPFFSHWSVGTGTPEAAAVNVTLDPITTTWLAG